VEGAGAPRLLEAFKARNAVVSVRRTERGLRVGIAAGRTQPMELAAGVRDIERLSVRSATLEDVYFVKTVPETP
jgi:hypothetical protein